MAVYVSQLPTAAQSDAPALSAFTCGAWPEVPEGSTTIFSAADRPAPTDLDRDDGMEVTPGVKW